MSGHVNIAACFAAPDLVLTSRHLPPVTVQSAVAGEEKFFSAAWHCDIWRAMPSQAARQREAAHVGTCSDVQ